MRKEQDLSLLVEQAENFVREEHYLKAFKTLLRACDVATAAYKANESTISPVAPSAKKQDEVTPPDLTIVAPSAASDEAKDVQRVVPGIEVITSFRLNQNEPCEKEKQFRSFLENNLFGQPEAVDAGVEAYLKSISPVKETNRPCFVIMSLGQSRTGKSELPRLFAQYLHGSKRNLLRVNLAQYQHDCQITTLIGASPTWVGYDQPATFSRKKLTESRGESTNPQIVLVLEEIEKAHPAVADVLLGVFDNGEAELANGQISSFTDVIVFMTSNLGSAQLAALGKGGLGFNTGGQDVTDTQIRNTVQQCLSRHYRPEFVNRIDRLVVYRDLSREAFEAIVDREIRDFQQHIKECTASKMQFEIVLDESARGYLIESSLAISSNVTSTKDGIGSPIAELHRLISSELSLPIQRALISGLIRSKDRVVASYEEGSTQLILTNHPGGAEKEQPKAENEAKEEEKKRESAGPSEPQVRPQDKDGELNHKIEQSKLTVRLTVRPLPGRYLGESKNFRALPYENVRPSATRHPKSELVANPAAKQARRCKKPNAERNLNQNEIEANARVVVNLIATSLDVAHKLDLEKGKPDEAKKLLVHARRIAETVAAGRYKLQTRFLLARSAAMLEHDYVEVTGICCEALTDQLMPLATERFERALSELAQQMEQDCKFRQLLSVLELLIKVRETLYGENCTLAAEAHWKLGLALQELTLHRTAAESFAQATAILKQNAVCPRLVALLRCDHAAASRSARSGNASDDNLEAVELVHLAAAALVKSSQEDFAYGRLLQEQGANAMLTEDYQLARSSLIRATEIIGATRGTESLLYARVLDQLVTVLCRLNEYDFAEQYMESALGIFAKLGAQFNAEAGRMMRKLSGIYLCQRRFIESSMLDLTSNQIQVGFRNGPQDKYSMGFAQAVAAENAGDLENAIALFSSAFESRRNRSNLLAYQLCLCARLFALYRKLHRTEEEYLRKIECLGILDHLFGKLDCYKERLLSLARVFRLQGDADWSISLETLTDLLYEPVLSADPKNAGVDVVAASTAQKKTRRRKASSVESASVAASAKTSRRKK